MSKYIISIEVSGTIEVEVDVNSLATAVALSESISQSLNIDPQGWKHPKITDVTETLECEVSEVELKSYKESRK